MVHEDWLTKSSKDAAIAWRSQGASFTIGQHFSGVWSHRASHRRAPERGDRGHGLSEQGAGVRLSVGTAAQSKPRACG